MARRAEWEGDLGDGLKGKRRKEEGRGGKRREEEGDRAQSHHYETLDPLTA